MPGPSWRAGHSTSRPSRAFSLRSVTSLKDTEQEDLRRPLERAGRLRAENAPRGPFGGVRGSPGSVGVSFLICRWHACSPESAESLSDPRMHAPLRFPLLSDPLLLRGPSSSEPAGNHSVECQIPKQREWLCCRTAEDAALGRSRGCHRACLREMELQSPVLWDGSHKIGFKPESGQKGCGSRGGVGKRNGAVPLIK